MCSGATRRECDLSFAAGAPLPTPPCPVHCIHPQSQRGSHSVLTSHRPFEVFEIDGQDVLATHKPYDVIVVGGGHAGCEASAAAARSGARTMLVTPSIENLGICSCNPSFGGIGKGTMLREIDALDGVVGRVVDKAGVQFRVLNKTKGPAVWGPRAQIDRKLYQKHMRREMTQYKNLEIIEGSVEDIIVDKKGQQETGKHGKITGVRLEEGSLIPTNNVVITTGTFLQAEIHIGKTNGGAIGDVR